MSSVNLPYRERLLSERQFVQYCINFDDAANYEAQRASAASYLFYILIRVTSSISYDSHDID